MDERDVRRRLLEPPEDGPDRTVFAELDGDLAQYVTVDDPLHRFDIPVAAEDVPVDVLDLVEEHVTDPDEGFFGPESMLWTISKENVLLLGSLSTILLQIAHPKVAQGIADFGSLHTDAFTRFERTFDIFDTVMFGDVVSAVRAAVIVRTLHERVRGELSESTDRFEAGERYYANDPELLMWVAATLVEMPIVAYETYVRDLSASEKAAFYEDMKTFNALMGVPPETCPDTYEAFTNYYETTLVEDVGVTPAGAVVVDGFLDQFEPALPTADFMAGSLMPDEARSALGIEWGPRRQDAFDRFAGAIRRVPLDRLPDRVRYRKRFRLFGRHLSVTHN